MINTLFRKDFQNFRSKVINEDDAAGVAKLQIDLKEQLLIIREYDNWQKKENI